MDCPNCGHSKSVKNGFYRNNQQRLQRYICKFCERKYSVISQDQINTKQEFK